MEAGDKEVEELVADGGTGTWGHGLHSDAETQMFYHKFNQKYEPQKQACVAQWPSVKLITDVATRSQNNVDVLYLFCLLTYQNRDSSTEMRSKMSVSI